MRIVSLACSNTEIVTALGRADWLVGVDSHSDFPPSVVARLSRVGPDLEIDIEEVADLEPDLVLASLTVPGHETVVEGLEAAGLPHLILAPTSLEEIYADILEVARRLDAEERGRAVVDGMRRELEAPEADPDAPRILIQWWPKPTIAPCGRSWADQVIRAAGGLNPLSGEDRPSRPVEDEEVARLAPDAVILAWCGVDPVKYRPDVVYGNPAFRSIPAVRKGRVFTVPEAYLGRPGPRLVDGVRALRGVVGAIGKRA
jgi:iron complex transport system substrate-binding protein